METRLASGAGVGGRGWPASTADREILTGMVQDSRLGHGLAAWLGAEGSRKPAPEV